MRTEEFYLVKKSKLIDLVAAYYKLTALENSGVDNWDWYGESLQSWLDAVCEEWGSSVDDVDFETVAEADLDRFGKQIFPIDE